MKQQSLDLKTWGGRRKGAGRKPAGEVSAGPREAREAFRPYQPVHVSLRLADHVWNLRSRRSFRIFDAALRALRPRRDFRVVHFSVQGNHIHQVVEAEGASALANGVRAFGIRLARGLNRMMGRRGRVFAGRYHAHVLRTPAEVANAVRYVLGNFASHAARRGERVPQRWSDPYSSAGANQPVGAQGSLFPEPATSQPRTWLHLVG
jgi:hypothetical protein